MAGRVTRENFRAWNEEMLQRYDQELFFTHSALPVRMVERWRVRHVVGLLSPRESDRILEIGCGTGNVLREMKVGRVVGVDISVGVLRRAREKLGGRGRLISGDAEALPFPDQSFDKILCTEVLEHVLNPGAVISEIRRLMKSAGMAVVSVPNEGLINKLKRVTASSGVGRMLFWKGAGYAMPKDMSESWHLHIFDVDGIRRIVPSGLHIESITAFPSRLLPIRYVMILARSGGVA